MGAHTARRSCGNPYPQVDSTLLFQDCMGLGSWQHEERKATLTGPAFGAVPRMRKMRLQGHRAHHTLTLAEGDGKDQEAFHRPGLTWAR